MECSCCGNSNPSNPSFGGVSVTFSFGSEEALQRFYCRRQFGNLGLPFLSLSPVARGRGGGRTTPLDLFELRVATRSQWQELQCCGFLQRMLHRARISREDQASMAVVCQKRFLGQIARDLIQQKLSGEDFVRGICLIQGGVPKQAFLPKGFEESLPKVLDLLRTGKVRLYWLQDEEEAAVDNTQQGSENSSDDIEAANRDYLAIVSRVFSGCQLGGAPWLAFLRPYLGSLNRDHSEGRTSSKVLRRRLREALLMVSPGMEEEEEAPSVSSDPSRYRDEIARWVEGRVNCKEDTRDVFDKKESDYQMYLRRRKEITEWWEAMRREHLGALERVRIPTSEEEDGYNVVVNVFVK